MQGLSIKATEKTGNTGTFRKADRAIAILLFVPRLPSSPDLTRSQTSLVPKLRLGNAPVAHCGGSQAGAWEPEDAWERAGRAFRWFPSRSLGTRGGLGARGDGVNFRSTRIIRPTGLEHSGRVHRRFGPAAAAAAPAARPGPWGAPVPWRAPAARAKGRPAAASPPRSRAPDRSP